MIVRSFTQLAPCAEALTRAAAAATDRGECALLPGAGTRSSPAPFLERDTVRNNFVLSLLEQEGDFRAGFVVEAPEAGVVAAAVVAKGYGVALSALAGADPDAAWPALAAELAPQFAGESVIGCADSVDAFAAVWPVETRLQMAQICYELSAVAWPDREPPDLRMAPAAEADLAFLPEWMLAFMGDVGFASTPEQAAQRCAQRVAEGRLFLLWSGDRPLCMAALSGVARDFARVGMVYTPPEGRRQGAAAALVARLSQHVLSPVAEGGRGGSRVFIFTDVENPTSNSVYRRVGFEERCRFAMRRPCS